MFSAHRFQVWIAHEGRTTATIAHELHVSSTTVQRWRLGERPPTDAQGLLMRTLWGQEVWRFLTEQSDKLPQPIVKEG